MSHIACGYFRTSISQLTQWNNWAIHSSLRWSHCVNCLSTSQQPSQHMNLHAWPTRFTVLNSTEKGESHSHLSDQKTQSQICTTLQAGLATTWNLLQTQWELVFDCDGAKRLLSLAHSGMDWPHSTYHQNIRKQISKKRYLWWQLEVGAKLASSFKAADRSKSLDASSSCYTDSWEYLNLPAIPLGSCTMRLHVRPGATDDKIPSLVCSGCATSPSSCSLKYTRKIIHFTTITHKKSWAYRRMRHKATLYYWW
jgi:hypothetical protein